MHGTDRDRYLHGVLQSGGPSLDEVFGVLADRHRRIIVASLLESDNSVPVDALVTDLVLHADVPVEETGDARTQIATRLHHVHLPKLAEADLLKWDREHAVVAPTDYLPPLAPFVETATLDRFYR